MKKLLTLSLLLGGFVTTHAADGLAGDTDVFAEAGTAASQLEPFLDEISMGDVVRIFKLVQGNPTVQTAVQVHLGSVSDAASQVATAASDLMMAHQAAVTKAAGGLLTQYQQGDGFNPQIMFFVMSEIMPLISQLAQSPEFGQFMQAVRSFMDEFHSSVNTASVAQVASKVTPEVVTAVRKVAPQASKKLPAVVDAHTQTAHEAVKTLAENLKSKVNAAPLNQQQQTDFIKQVQQATNSMQTIIDAIAHAASQAAAAGAAAAGAASDDSTAE